MTDYKNCKRYAECEWRKIVSYCPEECNQFKHKDEVIVVRCKDCKHYDNSEGIQWCHLNSKFAQWGTDWHSFPEDGFCSYGERRTDV